MELSGTRFGTIQFADEDVMTLPAGLVGFGQLHQFVILPHREDSPFHWMQSLEEPSIAFLVTNPWVFEANYQPDLTDDDASILCLSEESPYAVWSTVNLRGADVSQMTLNLAAPIVINMENRIGKQVVLEAQAYNMRHRVFREVEGASSKHAA